MQFREQAQATPDQVDLEEAIESARRRLPDNDDYGQGDHAPEAAEPWINRAALRAEEGLYRLYFADELGKFSQVRWLIPGIFQLGEASLVYGPGGLGKSALIQDWMVCVSYGLPILGRPVKRRAVLYICAEGASGVKARFLAARAKYGKLDEEPALIVTDAAPDLIKRRGDENPELEMLSRTVKAVADHSHLELGAVVIDTVSKCCGDGDENSTRDMNAFIRGIYEDVCRPSGAATIAITHSGKDISRGVRGASALSNGSSAIFRIGPDDQTTAAIFTCEKQKEGKPPAPFKFLTRERSITDPDTGDQVETVSVAPAEDAEQRDRPLDLSQNQAVLLKVLQKAPRPLSNDEWRDAAQGAGVNPNRPAAFREAKNALLKRGLVREVGGKFEAV